MALTLLAANNASTVLTSAINANATTLTVNAGTGSLFPSPVSGVSYFKLTLIDATTGTLNEIVHVTERAGDVMTIERAQEGTVARLWSVNDIAANMLTAGSLSMLAQKDQSLQIANNFSEISTAGAQADSRKNLGLKSAATYDVGTGSGQIPDMSSQQKGIGAGVGWQKLPSGLILQWGGTSPIAGSGSSVNVTFPIEFPNAVVGVVFQSITEVSPSCAFFMHSDLTTSSMKTWGVAKVIAAGATTAPLSAGISASWLVWGY